MLKREREWGTENNGKLPHLFFPGKTATLVPEFAVEDLPSAELQPCVLHLLPALGQNTHDDDDDDDDDDDYDDDDYDQEKDRFDTGVC